MSVIVLSNAIPDGSLNGGITNVATSLTLQTGEGATFPTPPFKIGINSEAMLCTAKATDTLTVTRNYDGTTATAHSDTDVVKHIFTAEDFPFRLDDTTDDYMLQKNIDLDGNAIIGLDLLHSVKASADTPDDEFDSTTLDAQWTAVSGASGTVDIMETGEVEKYDLTTKDGWILMQAGSASGQAVFLRQDFTIPDGSCIVGAFSFAWAASDSDTGIVNNEQRLGFYLNSSDTSPSTGTHILFHLDTDDDANRCIMYDGSTVLGSTGTASGGKGMTIPNGIGFLRLQRDGLDIYGFYSVDGHTWMPIGKKTFTTIPDNLWLTCDAGANGGEPVPIHGCKWVRQGGSGLDPWTI